MTNKEFRSWLEQFGDEAEVLVWDPDGLGWFPVTGALEDNGEIKLYADEQC